MKKITLAFLLITLSVFVISCKKTVEGESNKWNSNVNKLKALAAEYPGFAAPLNKALDAATSIHLEAEGISDEELKISRMSEANGLLRPTWVRDLEGMEDKMAKLRTKMTDINSTSLDEGDQLAAEVAAKNAQDVVNSVGDVLKSGANDASTAKALLTSLTKKLETASKDIEKVMANAKDKQVKEETKNNEEKKALADWKCEYCDNMNPHDDLKCSGCGANRPQQ